MPKTEEATHEAEQIREKFTQMRRDFYEREKAPKRVALHEKFRALGDHVRALGAEIRAKREEEQREREGS